jgi:hypothetical protein
LTHLLHAWSAGEALAAEAVLEIVYGRLRQLAANKLRVSPNNGLEPTELANELVINLLEARVEVAAKGVLQDPDLALKLIDLSTIGVGDDGTVDRAAVEAAVADLVKNRPYLGVQDPGVFRGGADTGPRKEDVKSLDQQIADARANGDWRTAIRLENQKLPLGG